MASDGLQCKSLQGHTLAAPGAADFLCLLCFRPGASSAKAGVPRTGRRVQSNLIILSCAVKGGQTPSKCRDGRLVRPERSEGRTRDTTCDASVQRRANSARNLTGAFALVLHWLVSLLRPRGNGLRLGRPGRRRPGLHRNAVLCENSAGLSGGKAQCSSVFLPFRYACCSPWLPPRRPRKLRRRKLLQGPLPTKLICRRSGTAGPLSIPQTPPSSTRPAPTPFSISPR